VRQPIWLRKSLDGLEVSGLLIELSTEGCRISNLGCAEFSTGDAVTVQLDSVTLTGRIRWTRQGIAGVRLDTPLNAKRLSELVEEARGGPFMARYGT
jgi:hypothetical protein